MSLVVGVDAGGTRTRVLAERDGVPAGTFEGDAANVRTAGIDAAADTIARSIGSAVHGVAPSAVYVGAAGAGGDGLARALQSALEARLPGARVAVGEDAPIALRAAVSHGDGIVVIAGTGSIAYAQIGDRALRAGGHGLLLGDEGSGAWIGASASRLLARAYDERVPRDPFLDAIEAELRTRDAHELHARVYDDPSPARLLASLAPIVLAHAASGERSATKIVQAAALELHDLVKSLARRAECATRELPIVFAGGLLAENSLLSFLLETRVVNDFPHFVPLKNPPPPAQGALVLARALQ